MEQASAPAPTTRCSPIFGWRCNKRGRRFAMKAILLGAAAVSLLTVSAAFGADLAVPPAPRRAAAFHLDELLRGRQRRRRVRAKGSDDTAGMLSPHSGFSSANLDISGYLLGGQIGCDYQFASNWVLGIEGAASGGDIGGKTASRDAGNCPATPRLSRTRRTSYQRDRARRLRLGSLAALRQRRRRLRRRPIQRPRRFRRSAVRFRRRRRPGSAGPRASASNGRCGTIGRSRSSITTTASAHAT